MTELSQICTDNSLIVWCLQCDMVFPHGLWHALLRNSFKVKFKIFITFIIYNATGFASRVQKSLVELCLESTEACEEPPPRIVLPFDSRVPKLAEWRGISGWSVRPGAACCRHRVGCSVLARLGSLSAARTKYLARFYIRKRMFTYSIACSFVKRV